MSTTQIAREASTGGGAGSGGGAAPRVVGWLGLAAAPTFALMGLWTALFSAHPATVGMAMGGSSPMSGMTLMYLLMSVFHSSPWTRLIASRMSGWKPETRTPKLLRIEP